MAKDFIVNDTTPNDVIFDPTKGRGLNLEDRPRGYAYGAVAEPFPDELLIPRSEWQARIKEMEDTKTRITDLCDLRGLKVKDQARTNFCWFNAPTHCLEIDRVMQNESPVSLSPASGACKITNFRNVGGWGKQALEFIIDTGVVPSSMWPDTAIDRQYDTAATNAERAKYRVVEWWELEPRNLDQLMSVLLRRWPVAVGYNWWSHEVTAVNPRWIDGAPALDIDNSWGTSWGTNGRGVLQGNRMLPDDAVVPRTALAS